MRERQRERIRDRGRYREKERRILTCKIQERITSKFLMVEDFRVCHDPQLGSWYKTIKGRSSICEFVCFLPLYLNVRQQASSHSY